ncbi:MAG: Trk system potassium transporter TrkA [Planctomycetota bacterium]
MRIVVLGAGTVGRSIAALLVQAGHSLTVIDSSAERVRQINDTLDARAIEGSASQASVLFQAGIGGADLCLAMTGCDEVNLVGASMGAAMGARRTVARVYAPVFRDLSTFDYRRHFGVDRLLSIEQLTALELAQRIRHPGSVAVENLAGGELEAHELLIDADYQHLKEPLKDLPLPRGVRIGSIARAERTWVAGASDTIQADDRITLIGQGDDIDKARRMFDAVGAAKRRVVVAGGGETGYHLANALESPRISVTLMESDRSRCEFLASRLTKATVVHRDATLRVDLEEERVGSADVFVACTGDDENNIVAAVEAKDIGARQVMSLVGRPDYAQVVGRLGIDYAVSPREVVAKQVLGYLTTGPVVSRATLSESHALAILELDVQAGSSAVEKPLFDLELPPQCLIAAVVREGYASVPGANDRFQPGDTVVALVAEKSEKETVALFAEP